MKSLLPLPTMTISCQWFSWSKLFKHFLTLFKTYVQSRTVHGSFLCILWQTNFFSNVMNWPVAISNGTSPFKRKWGHKNVLKLCCGARIFQSQLDRLIYSHMVSCNIQQNTVRELYIRHESEDWGFESPSVRLIFRLKTFPRTSVCESKMSIIAGTQFTPQMLTLIQKIFHSLVRSA